MLKNVVAIIGVLALGWLIGITVWSNQTTEASVPSQAVNELDNADFTDAFWRSFSSRAEGNCSRQLLDGEPVARVVMDDDKGKGVVACTQVFDAAPGDSIDAAVDYLCDTLKVSQVEIQVKFIDSNEALIEKQIVSESILGAWDELTISGFVAPPGTVKGTHQARVFSLPGVSGGLCYFDNALITIN